MSGANENGLAHRISKLFQALEKEEGIKPMGSAQAELLALLYEFETAYTHLAYNVANLREEVRKISPDAAPMTLRRIEEKLDRVLDSRRMFSFWRRS